MRVLVTAGNGGIGLALIAQILDRYPAAQVAATWHKQKPDTHHERLQWFKADLSSETQVAGLAETIDSPRWLINTAGLLHDKQYQPEKSVRSLDPEFFLHSMKINALPTLLLAKHFHRRFENEGIGVFAAVSARVGSIEDNRLGGWTSYRCSKAALNMAIKNVSVEWARTAKNVSVVALHPGTTNTPLSEPFQTSLKPGQLFSAAKTAGLLVDVIEGLTPEASGQFLSWDGTQIPW